MKPVIPSLLALALATGALQAQTSQPNPMYTPLRPVSSCLRTDRINEWHIVDTRTVIARTGPDRYMVKLQTACPRLGYGPRSLMFHSNPANQAVIPWSICGEVGETVRAPNQPPCAIQSVSKINKPQFDQLSQHALRHGSGADQPIKP
ncbi:MAG: DUF6491 family protein [Rhodanobacter sp.]